MPQTIKKSISGLNLTYGACKMADLLRGGGAQRSLRLLETLEFFFNQQGLRSYKFEITNQIDLDDANVQPIVKLTKQLADGKTLDIGTMLFTFSEDEKVANVNVDCSNNIIAAIVGQAYNPTELTHIEKDTHFLTFADSLERLDVALLPPAAISIATSASASSTSSVSPPTAAKKLFAWGGFLKRVTDEPDSGLSSQQEVMGIINQILPDLQKIPDRWERSENISQFAAGAPLIPEPVHQYRGMTDLELTNRSQIADKITAILGKYQQNQQPTRADINELRGAIDKLEGAGSETGRKRYAGILAASGAVFAISLTIYIIGLAGLIALAATPALLLPVAFGIAVGIMALIWSGFAYRGNKPSFMPAVLYHIADKMEALISPEVGPRPGSPAQKVEEKREGGLRSTSVYSATSTRTSTSDPQAQEQQKKDDTTHHI